MTQPSEDFLVHELQPVTFKLVQDDGHLAVYRALAEDLAKSRTVFSLTATTASPVDAEERTAQLESLNEIKAAFYTLNKPGPPNAVTMEPEPFDPVTEVMIEIGLADPTGKSPVSFAAAVQATVSGTKVTVRKVKPHVWSTGGSAAWATLNVSGGAGTVQPHAKLLSAPYGYTNTVNAVHEYQTYSNKVTLSTTALNFRDLRTLVPDFRVGGHESTTR
jgi:hypothetical protein